MANDDAVTRALEAVTTYFVGDSTMSQALDKICAAALQALPVATMAGVSMTVEAKVGTYIFTHPDVVDIDRAQYETGEGPCVDAFTTGVPVIIDSVTEAGPYPRFRAAVAAHGLASVMSVPMSTPTQTVGALNFYAASPGVFDDAALSAGRSFATQAAYLLLNHQAYWDARSMSESLQQAMASRAEIEQAKGIIMGTTGCTPDEAFDRLREQSQHENVKLRDLAREIVQRARRRVPD
ncbi:MAG: GAF and ANTAR domain-containing protein [Acidimicrobiia bacterium]